jgi:hypothetical protein
VPCYSPVVLPLVVPPAVVFPAVVPVPEPLVLLPGPPTLVVSLLMASPESEPEPGPVPSAPMPLPALLLPLLLSPQAPSARDAPRPNPTRNIELLRMVEKEGW